MLIEIPPPNGNAFINPANIVSISDFPKDHRRDGAMARIDFRQHYLTTNLSSDQVMQAIEAARVQDWR